MTFAILSNFFGRLTKWVKPQFSNLAWSVFTIIILIGMDITFSKYINILYKFELKLIKFENILYISIIIFIVSYLQFTLRQISIILIFLFSFCQFLFFQYFGTYIQPISFIQFLPDFGLIALSFWDSIGLMYSILWLSIAALLIFLLMEQFASPRTKTYLAIPALIGILALDFFQTYPALNTPGQKISGRMTSQLLPGPNRLAADNAYRSLRYLVTGIFPQALSGNFLEEKPLSEPKVVTTGPQVNVVLIMGESVRASQLGVLGYKGNDTTPLLSVVGGLYSKSIYSSGTTDSHILGRSGSQA